MIREFFLECGQEKVAVAKFESKSKQCLVMLNGFSHSRSDFDYFYTDIAKKIYLNDSADVFLFDYIGHGDSTGSIENVTFSQLCESVISLLNEINSIDSYEHVILFGTGIAGLILNRVLNDICGSKTRNIRNIVLYAPSINYTDRYLIDKNDSYIHPCDYVSDDCCRELCNYDNEFILMLANLGCFIENVLGLRISLSLLNEIETELECINYNKFQIDTSILRISRDKRYKNSYNKKDVLLEGLGSGVLALNTEIKKEVFNYINNLL